MKNIALGQYYPSGSVIHRLDGRIKIVIAVLFIVFSFLCKSACSFAALMLMTVGVVLVSKIPPKVVLRSIRGIAFILIFTFLINMFFTKGDGAPLFEWRFISLYSEGIWNAAFTALRILALIVGSSIFLSYTTTPIELTDSLERLLSPLKHLHMPVHEFSMMMSIALRFIPTLSEETDRIISAQKARGADLEGGNIIRRIKMLMPILIPLFASALRRADELATAMECRCYHGGDGRTRMNVSKICPRDVAALLAAFICGAALLALNSLGYGYIMK